MRPAENEAIMLNLVGTRREKVSILKKLGMFCTEAPLKPHLENKKGWESYEKGDINDLYFIAVFCICVMFWL